MEYLGLIIVTLIIGMGASAWCQSALKKYSKVASYSGMTGETVAKQMLAFYGIGGVPVKMGSEGQDFFDPRSNSITLSPSVFNGRSVTSLATVCHECGHACQYAQNYTPMKVRTAIVPAVNLCSNIWMIVFVIGIMLNIAGFYYVAIALYTVSVLFALITLPVEFDASNRALKYMDAIGLSREERSGSAAVLRACAFTYVAAALTSLLQLLYLIGMRRD